MEVSPSVAVFFVRRRTTHDPAKLSDIYIVTS